MFGFKHKVGRRKATSKSPNLFLKSSSLFFKQDAGNKIFEVTSKQLPVLNRIGLDELFLTQGHIREPHWHPNAAELDYVVEGEVIISILDPFRHQLLTYHVQPGQVVYIPINWWHWITAVTKKVHIVQIFSHEDRQIIEGSDVLRKTPPEVFQLAYGVNAKQYANLVAPIQKTVVIGPPDAVHKSERSGNRLAVKDTSAGTPNLFFELKQNLSAQRDHSFLYEVTCDQIPMMHNLSLGDLYLTKGHIREPHWHPNADELDYVISGEVSVSILNPFTLKLHNYPLKPGQVAFIPKGWWHWITPLTDQAHLLVNFNDGQIESVEGSDVLRLTPPEVFQQAYGMNARQYAKEVTPITETLKIGPPDQKLK